MSELKKKLSKKKLRSDFEHISITYIHCKHFIIKRAKNIKKNIEKNEAVQSNKE